MKPDYKNWMPKGGIYGALAGTAAAGVLRVLKKGGCFAIHDVMSPGRYGDMTTFVRQLKAQGYAEVQLIDTTDGLFMSHGESVLLGLGGSTLLVGKK